MTFTRTQLLEEVWDFARAAILDGDPADPTPAGEKSSSTRSNADTSIVTVPGVGYRFEP